jgi:hypothetical protein
VKLVTPCGLGDLREHGRVCTCGNATARGQQQQQKQQSAPGKFALWVAMTMYACSTSACSQLPAVPVYTLMLHLRHSCLYWAPYSPSTATLAYTHSCPTVAARLASCWCCCSLCHSRLVCLRDRCEAVPALICNALQPVVLPAHTAQHRACSTQPTQSTIPCAC